MNRSGRLSRKKFNKGNQNLYNKKYKAGASEIAWR